MIQPEALCRVALSPQPTAFFTSAMIRSSSTGVIAVSAQAVAHKLPSSMDDIDQVVARMRTDGSEIIGEMQYEDTFRLAYIRGTEGIIVGLSEQLNPHGDQV